jgi:hypothetical protein
MVTIFKTDNVKNTDEGKIIYCELRGLSTDTKPISIGDTKIGNGSVFIETDTQKLAFFDETSQAWKEV